MLSAVWLARIGAKTSLPGIRHLFTIAAAFTLVGFEGVGAASKRKILWDNCVRLYGFDVQTLTAPA